MRYKTPSALEMAIKEAAKKSPIDTGRAISGFYFHRLLCRVFCSNENGFVLKGGQSMLARTVDARVTRDIDLLSRECNIDDALEMLKRAVLTDLDDFMRFEFGGATPIKNDDEYRNGLNVVFVPWLGSKRLQPISIDLVVDEIPIEDAEVVTPADRLTIDGVKSFDYLLYPVENALADKFCAIVERHGDRLSSRVKDLIDIAVYATTCSIDGDKLSIQLQKEAGARQILLPERFAVPEDWTKLYGKQFSKLHAQTSLPTECRSMVESAKLAGRLFDPVLAGKVEECKWHPTELRWTEAE